MYEEQGLIEVNQNTTSRCLGLADLKLVLETKEEQAAISSQQVTEEIGGKLHHGFHKFVKKWRHRRRIREEAGSLSAGAMSAGSRHHHGSRKYAHLTV